MAEVKERIHGMPTAADAKDWQNVSKGPGSQYFRLWGLCGLWVMDTHKPLYELSVQIENMKDTATIHIRVVGARPAGGGDEGGGEEMGGDEEDPGQGKVERLGPGRV